MAGAKPGVHALQLKAIDVPDALINGNKFIKWDDDTGVGSQVTLKVDPNGYILYWREQNKEMDWLDIAIIRDTRTGKYARIPKDVKLRDSIASTAEEKLEDRTMTIVVGADMVNISYISFVATAKEVAKEWTNALFVYATNLLAQNRSPLSFLEKCYSRLSLIVSPDEKIPVKNVVKAFVQPKGDDRKRVEKALELSKLPCGKSDQIDPQKFTFEDFMLFYRHLCGRNEVDKIFQSLGAKKKPYLTAEQFRDFLNTQQRDPRLNEILYPYTDTAKAQSLIDHLELSVQRDPDIPKGHLSQDGFLRYLLSDENALVPAEKLDTSQDMDQPVSHYFINSSHNTYLTGHQLTSRSSVEIYRQALLTGCRCVELDCWDGKGADDEPIITHGFTMCTEIIFKEVIEAIAESAFKVSDYPVILSFENHCSPKQQIKMAQHCRNILGDLLLTDPLESHPLEPNVNIPSPEMLKGKILVKNKKRHTHRSKKSKAQQDSLSASTSSYKPGSSSPAKPSNNVSNNEEDTAVSKDTAAVSAMSADSTATDTAQQSNNVKCVESEEPQEEGEELDESSDSDSEDEEEYPALTDEEIEQTQRGTAGQEAEAGMEMSALVNYIQPVQFHSFESAHKKNKSYECVSFVETQASSLLKEFPVEFVNYNKRQLSRIYPKGTRVDSSNYMPQIFWNAGCQLVALNFQTLDLAMQLNLGIFEYNGRSGYILKPDFMRRKDRQFDPFAESTVDGIVAGSVEIKVISGQFLTEKKLGTYVEVEMYGLPADTVRKKFKTKVIPANGICPVYDEEPFKFRKVVLPTLATLRLIVSDEKGKLLGQRVLPVEGLRPGYRHICLRNELNQPLSLATLFVHIKVGDYVPDAFADFAEALSNPIAYQSKLEKHTQQLAVLEEDFEVDNEAAVEEVVNDCKISKKRASSVMSRNSEGAATSTATPTHLSRGGSLQNKTHVALVKQDSSNLAISQGSLTSGTKTPSTYASPQNSIKYTGNQPENGVKISTIAGAPKLAPKVDFIANTQLKDPDVVGEVSIEILKQGKQYVKIMLKFEKELDTLRKKQEKSRANLQEAQELLVEKLIANHTKSKTVLEKTHQKSFKRASKQQAKYGNVDDISHKNLQEMNALILTHQDGLRDLKTEHVTGMSQLKKEHLQQELELRLKYHPLFYDTLTQLTDVSLDTQMKRLEEIHDREVLELKKKLDQQNREEMKTLAKNHKDKSELDRLKREARSKHINLAVQERQKLQDMLEKRREEVKENHRKLKEKVQKECAEREEELSTEFRLKREATEKSLLEKTSQLSCSRDTAVNSSTAEAAAPPNTTSNGSRNSVNDDGLEVEI